MNTQTHIENNPDTHTVTMANENRLDQSHYSEALTTFSSGWKDPENLADLLEFLAPSVPVGRRFEFKRATNAESFLSESDDIRAIGSSFKRVEYTGDTVYEKTLNKGLTIRVDNDEIYGDNWEERYVHILMQRLYRNEIHRALAAISQAATNTDVDFLKDGNLCNPDAMLRKMLLDGSNASGIRPNRILMSELSWEERLLCYEAQNNPHASIATQITPDLLARKLMVDKVEVMKARACSDANTNAPILGKEIYAFFAQNTVTKDEPSNLKRFVTPVNGSPFAVYIEAKHKYTYITVEHYSSIVVTSNLGIQKITIN